MHRWRKLTDRAQILLVGADNFPSDTVKEEWWRQWFFDTAAGKEEFLSRRMAGMKPQSSTFAEPQRTRRPSTSPSSTMAQPHTIRYEVHQ